MRTRLVFVGFAAILVYCTFPSVTYDSSDATTDATIDDASDDAGDASPDVADVNVPEAEDDGNDPCDLDHDGFRAEGGLCDGTDCNDNDPRVNPAAGFREDIPDAFPNGDWNCDGTIDRTPIQISCTLNLVNCNTPLGYSSNVGCGLSAFAKTCTGLCSQADAGVITEQCR